MSKPVKILAWVVGILVLLLVAATVALKVYLTKERILAWVVPPLEEKLQRKVSIADAGAGLTGIHLDGLDVRAEGAEEPLVAAETIRVRWNLMALLSGKVEVNEVRLVEPRIHVTRLPDGSLDIDDLRTEEKPSEKVEEAEPAAPGEPALEVAVALFSMENGRVSFEDRTQKPKRTYVLDAIDSRIRDVSLDRPFGYELSANLPLAEAGRFSAEGTVNPATQDVTAQVRVKDFDLPSLNDLLEGGTRFGSGVFGLDLDLQVAGGARADVKGNLGIKQLVLVAGDKTGEATNLSADVEAGADLKAGTAALQKLDLTAADQVVHVTGTAKGLTSRPRVDFQVESDELRIDPLTALLPPGEEEPAPAEPKPSPAGEPAAIPLDAFGDVRLGKVLAGGLAVEDFTARIELDRGVLRIKPAGASVYGGTLALDARAELEQQGPPFGANVQLAGTQVAEFLAGLSPKLKDAMTGTLEMSLDAQGVGGDLGALRSSVRAEAKDGKLINHPLVQNFAQLFKVKELETLNFYSLKADVETAKGVGQLNSLILNGPSVQATGKGTFGLTKRDLDMQLAVALPKRIAGKIIPDAKTLDAVTDEEGWTRLPMKLKGSLDNPSYGLDTEGLAAAAAKAFGDKAKKLVEEKVLKKVPLEKIPLGEEEKGRVEEGLKKLFGQ